MNQMMFSNPVLKKGLNFTVRKGNKWAEVLNVGDQIHCVCPLGALPQAQLPLGEAQETEYIGMGKVTHVIECALKDLPSVVLKNEHDPRCQNPFGLFSTLQEVYEETFTDTTLVTAIGFEYKPQEVN